ncbi:MAG: hypothetical protein AAF386_13270 [Pseudomonadota bacterium]
MRSTIFTSFCCVVIAASMAVADAPAGCFGRGYSADHLRDHPNQHVIGMMFRFNVWPQSDEPAYHTADFLIRTRDVGSQFLGPVHVSGLGCNPAGQAPFNCYADCDGGTITLVASSPQSVTFETRSLALDPSVEGCHGDANLLETGTQRSVYYMTRLPDAACAAVFGYPS